MEKSNACDRAGSGKAELTGICFGKASKVDVYLAEYAVGWCGKEGVWVERDLQSREKMSSFQRFGLSTQKKTKKLRARFLYPTV